MTTQEIQQKIRSERKKLNISAQVLADNTETTQSQILNFENGKGNFTLKTLQKIVTYLKLKIEIT